VRRYNHDLVMRMKRAVRVGVLVTVVGIATAKAAEQATAHIVALEGKASVREGNKKWKPLTQDTLLRAEQAIRTDASGPLVLQFAEGSRVKLRTDTEIELASLENAHHEPFIQIQLVNGWMEASVAKSTAPGGIFTVHTPVASVIVEGTEFSVQHNAAGGLTTVAVREGTVLVQPESESVQPFNLTDGEQSSVSLTEQGPIVAAGAPADLSEPELPHRLRFLMTPHVPHAWDAILVFEETTGTLFASDLFTQFGKCAPTTTHDLVERAVETTRLLPSYLPLGPHTGQVFDRLEALNPKVIAGHHAPTFTGSALQALRDLRQALFTSASAPISQSPPTAPKAP